MRWLAEPLNQTPKWENAFAKFDLRDLELQNRYPLGSRCSSFISLPGRTSTTTDVALIDLRNEDNLLPLIGGYP